MRFFGRTSLVNRIVQGALDTPPAGFAVIGARLSGKTALLNALAAPDGPLRAAAGDRLPVDLFWVDCAAPGAYARLALQGQQQGHDLPAELRDSAFDPADPEHTLPDAFQHRADAGRRSLLLLDNFDAPPARPSMAELVAAVAPHTAVVLTARQPLHDLDLARVAALHSLHQRFLGVLEPDAEQRWLAWSAADLPAGAQAWLPGLARLTGGHPFLLSCVAGVVAELEPLLASDMDDDKFALLRLRLAEHGRPLFGVMEQALHELPPHIDEAALHSIVQRLLREPVPIQVLDNTELPALNWLINQAMVTYDGRLAHLFSPLFADYLAVTSHAAPVPQGGPGAPPGVDVQFAGLTKMEEALLRYFLDHRNAVVSPQQLLADVWQRPDANHRRVQEAIRRLRGQLEQAHPPIGAIRNARGRGYRFIPA